MRKALRLLSLLLAILTAATGTAFAHGAQEHDRYLELALFGGEDYSRSMSQELKDRLIMLKFASYLSIDQFNGNGQAQLDFLRNSIPSLLPGGIDAIDFTDGRHRSYTHRGWDFVYSLSEKDDKAKWPLRKDLLLSVTNHVFEFQRLSGKVLGIDFGYHKQCNSFAALIYYVHVLVDHIADNDYRATGELKMDFARAHPGPQNADIFYELQQHLAVLFDAQKRSRSYIALTQELDSLAEQARALAASTGGIDSSEKFEAYQSYAHKLMQLLGDYLPQLLRKEEYFKRAFPI